MAFDEDPIVDDSSTQSNNSVNALNTLFCQANGFITRADQPDFGIDFTVELIKDGQATGNRFAVQLKSTKRTKRATVDSIDVVSYRMKTSRIGLLSRQSPGYGVIVLFDDETKTAYFELVENIVQNFLETKPPEWQTQETVSINFPISNVLDEAAVGELYDFFVQRFEIHRLLVTDRGQSYGIPSLTTRKKPKVIDVRDPKSVADFVSSHGAFLFNNRDYKFLFDLISSLPIRQILRDPELLFTATITYVETGRLIEGDSFMVAARNQSEKLGREKRTLLDLYRADIDFRLGRIDISAYKDRIELLLEIVELPTNIFGTRVRLDFALALSATRSSSTSENLKLMDPILNTITDIDESEIEEPDKSLLILHAVGNLNHVAINIQNTMITNYRIREKTGWHSPMPLRVEQAKAILKLFGIVTDWHRRIHERLPEEPDYLTFMFNYYIASNFFQQNMSRTILDTGLPRENDDREKLFESRFNAAIIAYNGLMEIGAYDEAYSAVTTAYEIGKFHQVTFNAELEYFDQGLFDSKIASLSNELQRSAYVSMVDTFYSETLPKIERELSFGTFFNIEPEQEEHFASTIIEAYGLPEDRKVNVVSEIRSNRKFYHVIDNPNIELLQNLTHAQSPYTMYSSPVIFRAVCRVCGYQTNSSPDVDDLIEQIREEHGIHCRQKPPGA